MILITAETILFIFAIGYILYLRIRVKSLKSDNTKLKEENKSLLIDKFVNPKI
jgi:hypothetical protein